MVGGRRFFIGGALALALLGGWEGLWRHRGFLPSTANSNGLWSVMRERASGDTHAVALLGSSRLQAAMDLDVLQRHFPERKFLQLSVNSAHLMEMLRDFAEDATFNGTVVCEVLPADLFTTHEEAPNAWVRQYHARPPLDGVEAALRTRISGHLVSLLPELGMGSIPHWAIEKHRAPPVPYYRMDARRQLRMNFELADRGQIQRFFADSIRQFGNAASDADMTARLDLLAGWVKAIRDRGGEVIFFRMLATKDVLAIEQERFSDIRYWARLAGRFEHSLSFQELPKMQGFACPDGTHIDGKDAAALTEVLAAALADRHWL